MVNDTADIDNWEGKTIQIYVWEVPEQLMNKLKSKWLVEIAAKKSIYKMIILSIQWNDFLSPPKWIFHM